MSYTVQKAGRFYNASMLLLAVYVLATAFVRYCYPVPHLTWDSFYYVKDSMQTVHGIRPWGYSVFLSFLYVVNSSVTFVVIIQFALFYLSTMFLLYALRNIFDIDVKTYFLTGLLLLCEPVSLYHCNSILSDVLFTSLSTAGIAAILMYLHTKRYTYLFLHIILICCSLEVRLIALFYPFFTLFVMWLLVKDKRAAIFGTIILVSCFALLYSGHIAYNKKHYGVPVFSAFSDWTAANNALYILPQIATDKIKDPDVRELHVMFKQYMDTTSFKPGNIGSGFMWDDKSPLNVLRMNNATTTNTNYNASWFSMAQKYGQYGRYIETHFPVEYSKGYILPDINTMLSPELGEMEDYKIPRMRDTVTMHHYALQETDLRFTKEPYRRRINKIIPIIYKFELLLFMVAIVMFFVDVKKYNKTQWIVLILMQTFVFLYYGAMLYSSWFLYRYLLPVYPIIVVFIIIVLRNVIYKRSKYINPISP
ncbi:MAG: hypothetical protein JST82_06870 [Bacteroidetes bacterium]|nr:hypothetical protein [Bacteroidota bacterium]